MRKVRVKALMMAYRGWSVVLALALASCGSLQRPVAERILQEGDCGTVPDIERLAITVSDHGAKVSFQWSGQRFAGGRFISRAQLNNMPAPQAVAPIQVGEP